ncbi:metal-dependent hydrolase [Wukongibacter baidiensis]|uniref:metal-dependent hydrolase n=1 Tax=Wukongibacter baidiensis TaxID=1723361 RepID=UPI003D7F977C
MMGRTHYALGVLYYLVLCIIPTITIINFTDNKAMIIGILAAAIGAIFPDADSDHSIINNRNPIFKTSNRIINNSKKLLKKIFAFAFFSIIAAMIGVYMYYESVFSKWLIVSITLLLLLALNGVKIGERIYIPILTDGLKAINTGAARIKKIFMTLVYLSIGGICIYLSGGNIEGIIWGIIFFVIAIFPHRTFLHSPAGLILVTVGVRYLEKRLHIYGISIAFFIGYFSHLYLADIFTNSGVPISTLPLILKKTGLHKILKKYDGYMKLYSILDKKLSIPLIKTGSKFGGVIEGFYVLSLFSVLVFLLLKS